MSTITIIAIALAVAFMSSFILSMIYIVGQLMDDYIMASVREYTEDALRIVDIQAKINHYMNCIILLRESELRSQIHLARIQAETSHIKQYEVIL